MNYNKLQRKSEQYIRLANQCKLLKPNPYIRNVCDVVESISKLRMSNPEYADPSYGEVIEVSVVLLKELRWYILEHQKEDMLMLRCDNLQRGFVLQARHGHLSVGGLLPRPRRPRKVHFK